MKVVLPSSGILGCKSVEMRQPTFGDLRNVANSNQQEDLCKFQFVQRLIDPSTNLNKVTKQDIEYLFVIAVFSMQFNSMSFTVNCPNCGKKVDSNFTIIGKELVTLERKGYPYSKVINGKEYTFHLLSAQNELDAINYALEQEDFKSAYEDACVCFILGKSLESVDTIKDIDVAIYLAAFLFQQAMFHGIPLEAQVKCDKCGKEVSVKLNSPIEFIRQDVTSLLKVYAGVSDKVSFEAFLDFTFPEYSAFVRALNDQMHGN